VAAIRSGSAYVSALSSYMLSREGGEPCGRFVCDEIWRFLTNDTVVSSSPTVVNGTVYIGGANKFAFPEQTTGRLYVFTLWDYPTRRRGRIATSPTCY
jgi:hypothetical protein